MLSIFHVPLGHLYAFFGDISIQVFYPFLKNIYLFIYLAGLGLSCSAWDLIESRGICQCDAWTF